MSQEKQSFYNIEKNIFYVFLASFALLLFFSLYALAQKELEKTSHFQLESFKLAQELRQSSDDLTRMVRTYVATKKPIYKQHYQEILNIRNGLKARPIDYDSIYWDLVMLDDKRPCANEEHPRSLLQRMRQAGFSREEFAKLQEAKQNSDALTKIEYQAMHLIEKNPNSHEAQEKALNLLFNARYHEAKKAIMQPIAAFTQLLKTRTTKNVQNAKFFAKMSKFLLAINILILLLTLWRLKKVAFNILGAPLHEVHHQLSQIGKGVFHTQFAHKKKVPNSIYALLEKTQQQLHELLKHNAQLSNLYALLSHSNQAIIHAKTQESLFQTVCTDTVTYGEFALAWIGLPNKKTQELKICAVAGEASEYVNSLHLSIDPQSPLAKGPAGQAYLTQEIQYFMDFQTSLKSTPWHAAAKKYNLASAVGIPLKQEGEIVAILVIYSQAGKYFTAKIRKLFEKMQLELNFALDNFKKAQRQEETDAHIYQLANYDALTHLANRSLFETHFTQVLSRSERSKEHFALMFVDLDNFKEINDTLGHSVGDILLQEVAKRFQTVSRDEDIIARQGGDEFLLLFPNTDAKAASQIAQKLLALSAEPFLYEGQELHTSLSIGITIYPENGDCLETLAKNADTAMYKAKEEGKNRYHFYTQTMHEIASRHLQLSNEMHHAIENNELEVYYQPQVDAKTQKLVGAEALIRWKHPQLGFIPPDEFIPIAEANGFIIPIGEWVLKEATRQVKAWMDAGEPPLLIAVNISAVQFRNPNITQWVEDILNEVGLASQYLELELTERVAMKNPEYVIETMNALHAKGIRMSIDDFGTGYSSLSYLKKFKVYKLKIDQSFVRDIPNDTDDNAIVNSIISMAKGLGLTTIAEGVETTEQLNYLKTQGCDEIQGYYYSKPLPAKEFEEFMQNLNKLSV